MNDVYLSLGSNLGQRYENLVAAINLLSRNEQVTLVKRSSFYQTSPVGGVVQDDFINMALHLETSLSGYDLLQLIHDIEHELKRVRKIHWGPRTIDIDILFFNELVSNDKILTLPHPEVFHRLFVLVPLLEIIDSHFYQYNHVLKAIEHLSTSQQAIEKINFD
ncbi:2-amino-4-hydroxy-6-hydroxymethyldihydropteridine diphosphokinase [Lactococcus fujiensis]|uniref:2-amino-4-hydroxy-6-hydroxymethyldihydropteridine diphosphokinase n=1 Tax=Lactococcus fujiensis JCM 16395 TaxID=1291764 RepID=A0A2A5RJS1_9LACT|nr:2-amino-4-hydroxy-6-hydroxymethyldihydropteridine diphosphokinase [Lactococcus fujiensis]PCR99451.1 2-amino-4-hydroxy-6-hydroxymethyldihydropteridine pyrophosphokinase [Lactococcus fujiensis JCM 16395]